MGKTGIAGPKCPMDGAPCPTQAKYGKPSPAKPGQARAFPATLVAIGSPPASAHNRFCGGTPPIGAIMQNTLYKRDFLSVLDLKKEDFDVLIDTALYLKHNQRRDLLDGRVVACCFFEPSTRTRLSFETAILRLGGGVIGFADASNTSMKKGETLQDTARIIDNYVDAIVMRHPQNGAALLASQYAKVPVINAGDGTNQHPSQTLLDLVTISETQGRLEGLKIALVGDLKYGRTVHSLAQAMCNYGCEFYLVSPRSLSMPEYVLDDLKKAGIVYHEVDDLDAVIEHCDIIYMTRVQKERIEEEELKNITGTYTLRRAMLEGRAKDNLKILHPLPRVDEIHPDVDDTPWAYYFEQANNGLYAREAILSLILNEKVR